MQCMNYDCIKRFEWQHSYCSIWLGKCCKRSFSCLRFYPCWLYTKHNHIRRFQLTRQFRLYICKLFQYTSFSGRFWWGWLKYDLVVKLHLQFIYCISLKFAQFYCPSRTFSAALISKLLENSFLFPILDHLRMRRFWSVYTIIWYLSTLFLKIIIFEGVWIRPIRI